MKFAINQIGTVSSPYKTKEECPRLGTFVPEGKGKVKIFPEYEEGLEPIETFSDIILFCCSLVPRA